MSDEIFNEYNMTKNLGLFLKFPICQTQARGTSQSSKESMLIPDASDNKWTRFWEHLFKDFKYELNIWAWTWL